jgi:CheY-like chemotaxis protein
MGGAIGVSSRPGQGSTFWFTARFPKQAGHSRQASDLPSEMDGLLVLVVDDNETNRRVLKGYLEGWNLRPTLACGGAEALEELRRAAVTGDAYRLVVLDMNMPGMDGEEVARAIHADALLAGTRIVILTSGWKRREAQAWEDLGVAGHLTKPVKPAQLFDCIALIMGTHAATSTAPATVTESTLEHAEERARLRILLVEDNPVNQKVAVAVLRRGGYRCDVVSDGRQAVERVARQRYDVVLMDCQMPNMDGFDATRRIRELEDGRPGAARLPIIAMTANALAGDRERCLAAGMDDYVSKPVKPAALYALLRRWVPAAAPADGAPVVNR